MNDHSFHYPLRGLAAACSRAFGAPTKVQGAVMLAGGSSPRETWAFEAVVDDAVRRLVLRRDPPQRQATPSSLASDGGVVVGRETEFRLMALARDAGVPSPQPLFMLAPEDGLGDGFVMTRCPGEAVARRIFRDAAYARARPLLVGQIGAILGRLHAIAPARLPALPLQTPAMQLDRFRALLDLWGEPHPVFELALRWLAEHAPPPAPPTLVHGDFRTGNYMVDEDGVSAVLDWELAHLGDPREDIGWFCIKAWRFGALDRAAGGLGDRETFHAAYRAAGGAAIGAEEARYWEVFGTLRWGIICMAQAQTHLSGLHRSVDLAAIGRRAVETEHDLLELIAG